MQFSRERYSPELIAEMMPLWQRHHDELAAYKDIPLNPGLEIYQECDKLETLRIFTARQDTKLQGYQVFLISPHLHSQQSIQAVLDIMYLAPEARRGLNGYMFLRYCDRELEREGVHAIYFHINAEHDFGVLLNRMGYYLVDKVYGRKI